MDCLKNVNIYFVDSFRSFNRYFVDKEHWAVRHYIDFGSLCLNAITIKFNKLWSQGLPKARVKCTTLCMKMSLYSPKASHSYTMVRNPNLECESCDLSVAELNMQILIWGSNYHTQCDLFGLKTHIRSFVHKPVWWNTLGSQTTLKMCNPHQCVHFVLFCFLMGFDF